MGSNRLPAAREYPTVMKLLTGVAVLSLLALAACQSTAPGKASPTVNDLKRLRVELVDRQVSIGQVGTALDALAEKGGNLDAEFEAYCHAVDDIDSHAERVRSIRDDLADSRQVYMRKWDDSSSSIQDASLKERSIERRDTVAAAFDGLRSDGDGLRTDFDAWLKGLTDTRKFLEFDLNPTGVASTQKDLGSLKGTADKLDERMGSFISDLDELIESLDVPVTAGS